MTASTASQASVDAAEALVQQRDVTHTLAQLLRYCAKFTSADAIGLLVKDTYGLDLLAAPLIRLPSSRCTSCRTTPVPASTAHTPEQQSPP